MNQLFIVALCLAPVAFAQEQSMTCKEDGNRSDRGHYCEIREATIPVAGRLDVDGGANGGISIKGGNRNDVLVRKLVCVGTVEDRIDQLIASKRDLAERVVGAGEGWLTELSTDDLADVLRLSAEASVGA